MPTTIQVTTYDVLKAAAEDIDSDDVYLKVSNVAGGPSGNVNVTNGAGASAVNIQDGGNSITVDGAVTVSATDLDIRNLVFATDKVDASGSAVTAVVTATNLDIRDLTFASDKVDASGTTLGANSGVDIGDVTINNAAGASAVNIQDGGNSITVDGTVAATQSGTWTVQPGNTANVTAWLVTGTGGTFPVTDSGGSLTVDNAGTFTVQASQAGTWVLGANSGVDIGDVTINNASGASAVNIQDGGNSITVDGTVTATPTGTYTTKETRSTTGTQTSVGDSASSVTILASNANRLGATIYNDSSAALYLKCGATASTTSFAVKLFQDDFWELPFAYTGIIDGIWASDAGGNARITEFT